jgi:anti-repressor protein
MEELIKFELYGNPLTVIKGDDGVIFFIAKEVCDILCLTNVSMALAGLDEDEKLTSTLLISGQRRQILVLTESGMYSIVMRSNKEEAKIFRKWVTSEVLPAIRKNGSFSVQKKLPKTFAESLRMLADETEARILAEGQLEASLEIINEMQPKAEYAEKVLLSESDITTTSIASELGMSAISLNKKLELMGIQRKHDKKWVLYARW